MGVILAISLEEEGWEKLKRVLKVLTVLLVVWLGITLYFITQHSVVGKEAKINKTIVFDDVTIELDSIVLYNFKRNPTNFLTNRNDFMDKLFTKLPKSLVMPYLRTKHLYSIPYEIDNKFYQTALYGKCVFTKKLTIATTEYHEYFRDHLSIYMVDSTGVGYSSGGGTRYEEDNSQELDFSTRGRDFPIEKIQEGVKVIIKHLENGEEREFEIDSQDFINYKHNDSFGKAFPFKVDLE